MRVTFRGHWGTAFGVAFSPDGQRVVTASADGTVRIWQCEVCRSFEEVLAPAEQRITQEFTCVERMIFLHEPCTG